MGGVCTIMGHDAPSCTDNFQIVRPPFEVAGNKFHSAEQAYQASKFPVGSRAFHAVTAANPDGKTDEEFGMEVWSIGNSFQVRGNWDSVKVKSMYVANLCKFSQNPSLADELASTRGDIAAAPSTWRWQFFNSKIMTKIRDLLANGLDLQTELARVELMNGQAVQRDLESYMSVSILETLMCAERNLKVGTPEVEALGMDQLHNAIVLLEKGYGADTEVDPLVEEFGSVDDVPEATVESLLKAVDIAIDYLDPEMSRREIVELREQLIRRKSSVGA